MTMQSGILIPCVQQSCALLDLFILPIVSMWVIVSWFLGYFKSTIIFATVFLTMLLRHHVERPRSIIYMKCETICLHLPLLVNAAAMRLDKATHST